MRKHHGLTRTHEEVVECLFERLDKVVIGCGERFKLCRVLDEFFGRLDAKGLGKPSVTLTLCALGHTFELSLFLGDGVAGTSAARHALLKMAARARLYDGCEAFCQP